MTVLLQLILREFMRINYLLSLEIIGKPLVS